MKQQTNLILGYTDSGIMNFDSMVLLSLHGSLIAAYFR